MGRRSRAATWLAIASVTLMAMPSAAEEVSVESSGHMVLPEIVVTATRIATPKEQVASSITVITTEDIARRRHRSIGDALRAVPSLSVIRSGAAGKSTAIFSRGARANHTLVLLDGIEMNDPSTTDGRMNFAGVSINDVERIEVLHGPQGTLYGSDAIGAVINIFTKHGSGISKASVMLEGGSFETFKQALNLRGSESIFDYSLSLERMDTRGISVSPTRFTPVGSTKDDDGFNDTTFSVNLGAKPFDIVSLRFTGRFTDLRNDLDMNVSPVQADNDSHSEEDRLFLGGNARLELFEGRSEHRFAVTYTSYNRIDRDDVDASNNLDFLRDKNLGKKLKFELQNDFRFIENHIMTIGLESEKEKITTSFNSTSALGAFTSSAKADARTDAIYLQDQISYLDRFFGTIGLRLDDHDSAGSEITYRFAPAYLHRETGTKIRAAYAKGFKTPSLFQLFGSSVSGFGVFTGNADLKPEVSHGWEVGFDQSLFDGGITIAVTYYDNEIKNLIESTATTNINLGLGKTNGIEVGITAKILDSLGFGMNYAYTRAEDGTTGQELLRRPLHKGGVDIDYRPFEPLSFSLAVAYIGSRHDIDASTFGRIKDGGYLTANLAASYDVAEGWQAFGKIENLLSKHYEDPDGFEQPGFGLFFGVRKTLEVF